ncbi:30S ribosomal protein S8 [Candidatus Kapabacteria bacterium]|nr:30S ribosomal protein S8 [Candidatus Kapabacteria bacterium]
MAVTDQIGDFITRIRNAGAATHKYVEAPKSKIKVAIAEILKDQGYIEDFEVINEGIQGRIKISLKYYQRRPVIKQIQRVSTPGRRIYNSADSFSRVKNGLGIAIVSTSRGLMTVKDAEKDGIGGEVICTVW